MNQVKNQLLQAYQDKLAKLKRNLADPSFFEEIRVLKGKRAMILRKEWMREQVEKMEEKIEELENGTK